MKNKKIFLSAFVLILFLLFTNLLFPKVYAEYTYTDLFSRPSGPEVVVYDDDFDVNHRYYQINLIDTPLLNNWVYYIDETFFVENSVITETNINHLFLTCVDVFGTKSVYGVAKGFYKPELNTTAFNLKLKKSLYTEANKELPTAYEVAKAIEYISFVDNDLAYLDEGSTYSVEAYFKPTIQPKYLVRDLEVFYTEVIECWESNMPSYNFLSSNVYGIEKNAYDELDTTEVFLEIDYDKTTYDPTNNVPGIYKVIYFYDLYGNILEFEQIIKVYEHIVHIEGPATISVDISETLSNQEIINKYIAYSSPGYTATIEIIENTYNQTQVTGVYHVMLKATDEKGYMTTKKIPIRVMDAIPPSILGPNYIVLPVGESLTDIEILSRYRVVDNYDSAVPLHIHTNEYNQNTEEGTYLITLKATDSSGNETRRDILIKVQDNTPPVITGINTFYIGKSQLIVVKDLVKMHFSATDNLDGIISNQIKVLSDNFTGNADKVGRYDVTLGVMDSAGNPANFSFKIYIVDDLRNYYIGDNTLFVSNAYVLADEDIIRAMRYIYGIRDPLSVSFVIEDYRVKYNELHFENEYQFRWRDTKGQEFSKRFSIRVVSSQLFYNRPQSTSSSSIIVPIIIVLGFIGIVIMIKRRKRRF